MTTDELFLYFCFCVAVYLFLVKYIRNKVIMHEAIKTVVAKHVHEIKTEQHGQVMYWFDKTSNQFFAQGKTLNDIIAQLKAVYPGHVFLWDAPTNKQYLLVGPVFELIVVDDGTALAKKDFE